ncbi:hypothetical protein FIU87_08290 [Bacillus sp. THAF10]|uniref:hypothetical protein n=1 Tax=Bacillus sp. THAF10 TaxID=2587848 RepID=UPI001267BC3B|nr:hypothetical protein [Bacillus sp. THAF10]QFT88639.1 hypothetical protein FIU87_08290 [Bacillus sp. THAF10]
MNMIAWMIVACEILFWVVIISGLVFRYVFNKKRTGIFLLALTPVVDLILIAITGFDLYKGATATIAHGVAAIYIGISIAFGKSMINWADQQFKYYVTRNGEKQKKRYGKEFAFHYAKGFLRHITAFIIGGCILAGMIYFINQPERTEALLHLLRVWTLVLGVDFLITCSYFIFPKPKKLNVQN